MKLLRDKSFSTQVLILYELYTKHYSKLSPMGEKIGVTQQAISDYMKKMMQQGLVHKADGEYKPTIKGVYLLQNELLNLKNFIDERIEKMSLVKNCVALAKTPIKTGESVGLFMDEGWLVAYANKKSSSMGLANIDANVGGYTTIGSLEGIIDHAVGRLYYFELPTPFTFRHNKIDTKLIRKRVQNLNIDRIGILDVVAKSVCKKIGIKPDFEFAAIHAAIDATQRGLNTAIFGYEEKIRETLKIFEKINTKSSEKISYEVFSIK